MSTLIRPADAYRWETVRRGLHLANRFMILNKVMVLFYGLWVLIGILLCIVYLGFVFAGKSDVFERALEPFALYGLAIPLALLFVCSWVLKLYSRLLWCAIPEPFAATIFAAVALLGRVATLYIAVQFWFLRARIFDLPPRPDILFCAISAWLGLISEWLFLHALPASIIASEPTPESEAGEKDEEEEEDDDQEEEEAGSTSEKQNKSFWNINLNDWFAKRFPRSTAFLRRMVPPLVLVGAFAGRADRSLAQSAFTLALIYPLILQVFWMPKQEVTMSDKP